MKMLSHKEASFEKNASTSLPPIKVCMHVRGSLRTDGRVRREASALVQAGFVVTVVDVERERTVVCEEELDSIHVKHLVKPRWFTSGRGLWRLVKLAEKFLTCTLTVCRVQADIYHAHDLNALPACYIAAKLRRKPLIYDAHEMPLYELDHMRWRGPIRRLLSGVFAGCAGIITVSPQIAHEIVVRHNVPNVSVVRSIPPYQLITQSDRLHQRLMPSSTTRIALYQGNLQMDRGLEHLIRAAKFLAQENMIVLMGRAIGGAQGELEALIASEGVAEHVKILAPVPYEELLEWTASADIGLIIYQPELSFNIQMCLPNKLFEYLMAGLPVLATPLNAVADILMAYQVGQVVPSLMPEDVAAAINVLLADQAGLEQMHNNALRAVRDELCWEKERAQLLHLYQKILVRDGIVAIGGSDPGK